MRYSAAFGEKHQQKTEGRELLLLLFGLSPCFVLTFRQGLLEPLSGAPSLGEDDSEFLVLLPLSPLH